MKFLAIAALFATVSAITLRANADPVAPPTDLQPAPSKEATTKKRNAEKAPVEDPPLPNFGRAQDVAHQENDKIVVATTTT